ncbi:MAG: MATE family efflux transporter [Clostridiaceae bacterium]|nr:MATE family efflux transporter [Clostridiaceae bacterium]
MEEAKQAKFIRMTTQPVEKLVCSLAVPTIISMLVTALYNMADTFFVGKVGTAATAGVGLIFPVMTIIQAFGFFFGQGSGNFISRSLGAQNLDESEKMAATGFFSALLFGGLIAASGLLFKTGVLHILGAAPDHVSMDTVRYAGDYLTLIMIGAPFMCASCVLNNQLRFQGNAFFSMIGLVSGAVLNCALDPLFIFTFHMEVKGAALATIISQFLSFCLLYSGTLKSDSLKIHVRNFCPNFYYLKNIFIGGAPSLFRQGLASVATLCLNSAAGAAVEPKLADAAIAAFSVVGKIMMFAFSALLGFGQGFQPVCGYNYGAKKYGRVRDAYIFCLKIGAAFLFGMSILGFVFAGDLVALFRNDPDVIRFGTIAMRCQCGTFTLMALVTCTNMLYQNIGRVVGATLLAVARQGLMFIPVVLILPHLFSTPLWGVYLAQPIADLFAFALALPLAVSMYRELKHREEELAAGVSAESGSRPRESAGQDHPAIG